MAVFNEIQIGRFNGILQKLLNMKDHSPAPALASDLSAGITLESDRPEWGFLAGENLLIARASAPAVAAQLPQAQLFNPVNSNVLMVLEKIIVVTFNTQEVTVNRTVVLAAASGSGSARDFRLGPPGGASTGRVTGVTPAGASSLVLGAMGPTATNPMVVWDSPIIISPGNGVNLNGTAVLTALTVTFVWRERVWELSERR